MIEKIQEKHHKELEDCMKTMNDIDLKVLSSSARQEIIL